jgi:hypothetical protein
MTEKIVNHFILGVTQRGNKFRPSDWVERIAAVFASFDASQRLRYSSLIRPAIYNGLRCLFVAGSLAMADPAGYSYVMDFAASNQLQVVQISESTETESTSVELPDVA